MNQPPTLPTPVPSAPQKKGIPGIAWLGIGCGGLAIIFIIVASIVVSKVKDKFDEFAKNPNKAAAELVVKMNPELEMVSQNEETGEMTIRTKSGEEITVTYEDLSQGNITIKDAEGNVTQMGSADLSKVPKWVPLPPDSSNVKSLYHTEASGQLSGQISGNSSRSPEEVRAFYENAASDLGLSSSSNKSINLGETTSITLNFSGGGQKLNIVITGKAGTDTLVNTNYSEEK